MSLIRAKNISLSYGPRIILDNVSFSIEQDARIALVGRNGEGKSTLLKIIAGHIKSDNGEVATQTGLQIAYLPQDVSTVLTGTVYEFVASGLANVGQLLKDYHRCSIQLSRLSKPEESMGHSIAKQLSNLQDKIDSLDGWILEKKIQHTLGDMQLESNDEIDQLSGGMKRRAILARALVTDPDVLLLDEPTNHLDMGAVAWLEKYLKSLNRTIMFVTHDRAFLNNTANHIYEIDRGQLTEWPGNYETYRLRKEKALEVEAQQNALFDKKLAQEEVWIRQGIKARRTRNEGRVRALKKMREQFAQRTRVRGTAKMTTNKAEDSGKIVFESSEACLAYGEKRVVNSLSTTILRDDRLGIIGPNGCGKSTIVKLLVGDLPPTSGAVKLGTKIQVAYFDQLRNNANFELSAADNVSGGKDMVEINGQARHIMSYMQDFLFEPSRARAPITALSGGELGRLMLAKLFLIPANVIVLDEPSNDLDIETLELLESLLSEYKGTVILISHDRQLIENVVTRSLVYQGNGRFIDVAGGIDDFERERSKSEYLVPIFSSHNSSISSSYTERQNHKKQQTGITKKNSQTGIKKKNKRTYAENIELKTLPDKINELESSLESLHTLMSQPDFFNDQSLAEQKLEESKYLQEQLDILFSRWEELESKTG